MTKTHPLFMGPVDTGRDIDPEQLLYHQMERSTVLAVSGGRWSRYGDSSVRFPCGAGYEVLVTLEANDTYTVRRLYKRGACRYLHGERTDVYAEDVSEVVYFASCFRSYPPGEWELKA